MAHRREGVEAGNFVFSLPHATLVVAQSVIGLLPVLAAAYLYARTVRPRTPEVPVRQE